MEVIEFMLKKHLPNNNSPRKSLKKFAPPNSKTPKMELLLTYTVQAWNTLRDRRLPPSAIIDYHLPRS